LLLNPGHPPRILLPALDPQLHVQGSRAVALLRSRALPHIPLDRIEIRRGNALLLKPGHPPRILLPALDPQLHVQGSRAVRHLPESVVELRLGDLLPRLGVHRDRYVLNERDGFKDVSSIGVAPKRAQFVAPTRVCVRVTSWRRLSGPRATGWRDALATPPPPSRLPLSRYATRARSSPAQPPGRQLEIVHLELSSPAFDPPAARPTRTTQLTLSPASSFDDITARTR